MKTYNQILEFLKVFTTRHLILQSFGHGTEKQLNSFIQNNTEAPLLYATITDIIVTGNLISYFIMFSCLDSRGKDQDNLTDIQSDTAQILIDLRSWLTYNFDINNIFSLDTEQTRFQPLVNHTNDSYSGWKTTIKISTILIESDCYIPIEEI
jgi:hypothetical protein